MNNFKKVCVAVFATILGATAAVAAPITLEGMNQITSWTDAEDQANDMPDMIWGTSDADLADTIGIHVEFEGGLVGSATYSGVSGLWNTANFTGLAADTATGFFTSAGGLHFLFNSARGDGGSAILPMAWTGFVMPFSNNFDVSYENQNNSDFRASVAGWGSAVFTTYSSTAANPPAVPVPAALPLLAGGLGLMGLFGRRRKNKS